MKLYCSMPLLGLYAARDHTIARKGADYALGPSPVAALVGKRGAVLPHCSSWRASTMLSTITREWLGKWFAGSLSGEETSHTVPEVRKGVLGLAGNQWAKEGPSKCNSISMLDC